MLAYVFMVCTLAVGYLVTLRYGAFENAESRTFIVFYAILPLVNAQFDFLSMTATRKMLREGLAGNRIFWGILDAAVGGICFLLLCFCAVAVATGANALSGETLIDLRAVFATPGAHVWLFAAFLTTLLPTFLHLTLVVFSFVFAWPERVRHWCAKKLVIHHRDGGSAGKAWLARAVIALMAGGCVAFCALVVRLIWMGFAWGGFGLGDALIDAMEGWHCVLTGVTLAECGVAR